MQYTATYDSPLGKITMAGSERGLAGLWFEGQKYFADTLSGETAEKEDFPLFVQVREWLDVYFSGKDPGFTPPLDLQGTPFRLTIWQLLQEIPYGETITYKEIAEKAAACRGIKTMSAQAVGGAVGHNPVSIIVPCHRVVGSNGSLTGYAGGIDKKIKLLTLEQAPLDDLFVPRKGTAL